MMLIASGVTTREPSRSFRPSPTRMWLALGDNCRPAPTSSSRSAFSRMTTRKPLAASASAAVNPPIPAPAMKIVRETATRVAYQMILARSGDLVLQDALGRTGLTGFQVGSEAVQRRAIGADDLVVV